MVGNLIIRVIHVTGYEMSPAAVLTCIVVLFYFGLSLENGVDARATGLVLMNISRSRSERGRSTAECSVTLQTLTCDDIPRAIPANITEVIIKNHNGDLSPSDFKDSSWVNVEVLYFSGYDFSDIQSGQFSGLTGVRELFLNLTDIRRFKRRSLEGLNHVQRLWMIDMSGLNFLTLEQAFLEPNVLPRLEDFVFNPGDQLNVPVFYGNDSFIKTLVEKPLRCLNLSNTIILVKVDQPLIKLLLKLDVLNISHATVIREYAERPEATKDSDIGGYLINEMQKKPLLQTLDVSGVKSPYGQTGRQTMYNVFADLLSARNIRRLKSLNPILLNIVNLYANNVQHTDLDFADSYDLQNTDLLLKRLYVRNNNVIKVTGIFRLNKSNQVELIDASENKLEYINPEFFSTAINLHSLFLSHNQLFHMQHHRNFSDLLKNLKELQVFDASSNKLSYLPRPMFQGNGNLRILNLAYNRFNSILFDLDALVRLEYLDLRSNELRSLDGTRLNHLQSFVHMRRSGPLKIDIEGNPLSCSCSSLPFIEWLVLLSDGLKSVSIRAPTCLYEGEKTELNQEIVNKCKFLCHRTLVIVMLVSSTVFIISFITSSVIVSKKCRQQRRIITKEQSFKRKFLSGELRQCYMVFLAYSSNDEDTIQRLILSNLNHCLEERLNKYQSPICTGDDFRPGLSIIEEIYRLVKLSCVFVAVISESFCRSPYCRAEIQEACNQNKPIILMFLGEVSDNDMTPYIKEIFRRNSRAKLVQKDDGSFEFAPSLHILCDSILQLAIDYNDR